MWGSAACLLQLTCRPPLHLAAESQRSETEDMNEVEKPQAPAPPRTTAKPAPKPKPSAPKKPASKPATPRTPSSETPSNTYLGIEDMAFQSTPLFIHNCVVFSRIVCFDFAAAAQNIKCETRLRDKCRGLTCNRSDYTLGDAGGASFQEDGNSRRTLASTDTTVQLTVSIRRGESGGLCSMMW